MGAARERAPRVAQRLARLLRRTPLAVRLEERCRLGVGDALPPRRRLRLAHTVRLEQRRLEALRTLSLSVRRAQRIVELGTQHLLALVLEGRLGRAEDELLLAELGCASPGGPLRLDRVELGEHAVEGSARLVAVGGEGLHDESRAPARERRSRVGGGVVEHRARSR